MPEPSKLVRKIDLEIQRDATHRACVLVAVATGKLPRADAYRAIGYLPGEMEVDMEDCAEAGARVAQAAREGGFQWRLVWEGHANEYRQAEAMAPHAPPIDRRWVSPPAARHKPKAFRPRLEPDA